MVDFKYHTGTKVKHSLYGIGEIRGRIVIRGKILLKDTYLIEFAQQEGNITVKEKDLTPATVQEWQLRFSTPPPIIRKK